MPTTASTYSKRHMIAACLLLMFLACLAPASAAPAQQDALSSTTLLDGELETLETGLRFCEGPVWVATGGYLLFSDIDASTTYKWQAGELEVFRRPSGRANGLTLDRQGRLLACEDVGRRIARVNADGTSITVADRYNGLRFNSPNDIVVHSSGRIYFTDPDPGLGALKEQPFNGVYRIDIDGTETSVSQVVSNLVNPNGLAFSPDETRLYVADTKSAAGGTIYQYDVDAEGRVTNPSVFCNMPWPDGMRVDSEGRVFAAAFFGDVRIYSPDKTLLEVIDIPGVTSNCAFGGADYRTLFIVGGTTLYSVRVKTPGIGTGKTLGATAALLTLR